MINNLPGPEKGLLETLFSSGEKTQAVLPDDVLKELAGKQSGNQAAQNFAELLKSSQDQKILAATELKNQVSAQNQEQTVEIKKDDMAALLQALHNAKLETTPVAVKGEKTEKAEKAEKAETPDLSAIEKIIQSGNSKDDKITKKEASLLQKTNGKDKIEKEKQTAKASDTENSDIAKAAAIAALSQAATPKESGSKVIVDQGGNEVLQKNTGKPDVQVKGKEISALKKAEASPELMKAQVDPKTQNQIPLAERNAQFSPIQMEVLASKDSPQGMNPEWGKSSSDFLTERAEKGVILGVNKPDPRLVGRTTSASSKEEDQSNTGSNQQPNSNMIGVSTESLKGGKSSEFLMKNAPINNVVPLNQTQSTAKVDAYNAVGLASEVNRLARQGGGSVRLKLSPENLGEMTVTVSQGLDKSLSVQFETANHEARTAILDSVNDLRNVLKSNNYNVENIGVELRSGKMAMDNSVMNDAIALDRLRSEWAGGVERLDSSQKWNDANSNSSAHDQRSSQNWQDGSSRGQGGRQGWNQRGYRSYQEMEYGA